MLTRPRKERGRAVPLPERAIQKGSDRRAGDAHVLIPRRVAALPRFRVAENHKHGLRRSAVVAREPQISAVEVQQIPGSERALESERHERGHFRPLPNQEQHDEGDHKPRRDWRAILARF